MTWPRAVSVRRRPAAFRQRPARRTFCPTASEGVAGFVDQLAKERGVPVAEVERDFFRTTRPASLLQRFIQPDEVASLVAYVCSPLAAATNGAALRVEGGCVRSMI